MVESDFAKIGGSTIAVDAICALLARDRFAFLQNSALQDLAFVAVSAHLPTKAP
jgi:hypothetical protein